MTRQRLTISFVSTVANVRLPSSEATYHLFESARAFAADKVRNAGPNRNGASAKRLPLLAAA